MQCPFCDRTDLIHDVRDMSYTYKGKSTTIADIEGHFCRGCKEGILLPRAIDRYGQLAREFRRKVDEESAPT